MQIITRADHSTITSRMYNTYILHAYYFHHYYNKNTFDEIVPGYKKRAR